MRSIHAVTGSALASVYECDAGEGIALHGPHGFAHGHCVIRGRTRVDIEGVESFERTSADPNFDLPADRRHAVTALEDDTIFVHVRDISSAADQPPAPPPNGGVLMDDGSTVYVD